MKISEDAYGNGLWSFYRGEDIMEIVERDDGFIGLTGGPKYYFSEYEEWPEIQKVAIESVSGRVLDLGAGAGRVSLYLQEKGFDVIAIDKSQLAIKTCRKQGVKKARVLSVDAIGRLKPGSIDTIILFGNNFGLFENFNKAKILLKKMHKITSPEGIILAESTNPYTTKDRVHLIYHKKNIRAGKLAGQTKIRVRFKNIIGPWFGWLLVSEDEMLAILKGTGWKLKKIIESDNPTYIMVIEKE